jgi:glycosyltransferase involved in cell wall biosynthesis
MLAQASSVHTIRWSQGLAKRGHRIRVISNSELKIQIPGVETILLPGCSSASYFFNIPRVRKLLHRIRPDILHSHYATGYGLWGTVRKEAPLIVTVWGTDIEDALSKKFMIAPIVRRALISAKFVTSASRFLIERTIAFEKSVADKIHLIPFGVPIPEISNKKAARENEGMIRIIFAKGFRHAYAPDLVLKAFASACKEDNRLRLTIIGGGPDQKRLEKLVSELKVSDRVIIRGWQKMDETAHLIENADIMVMPSRRESFGVAALEAISYGVPVIASRVGGLPEIIRDGVNGILVPSDDIKALTGAILRLATDPQLRLRMGKAGHRIAAEEFDFENCLGRMEELYEKALVR